MERVILSTKMGHYRIVSAKIIAFLMFTIGWITLFFISNFIIHLVLYKHSAFVNVALNSV
jgi:hypothetical protein